MGNYTKSIYEESINIYKYQKLIEDIRTINNNIIDNIIFKLVYGRYNEEEKKQLHKIYSGIKYSIYNYKELEQINNILDKMEIIYSLSDLQKFIDMLDK